MWFMLVSGEWLILRGGEIQSTTNYSIAFFIDLTVRNKAFYWSAVHDMIFNWFDLTWLYAKSDVYYLWFPRTEFNIYHLHCTSTALLREIKFHKPVNLPGLKSTRGMKVVDLSLHFSFHRPLYLYLITTSAYSFPFRFLIFFSVLTLSHLPYPLPSCFVLFCSVLLYFEGTAVR